MKKTFRTLLIASCAVLVVSGAVIVIPQISTVIQNGAAEVGNYTLSLTSNNPVSGKSYSASETTLVQNTSNGNPLTFGYINAIKPTTSGYTTGYFAQLKASAGSFYNKSAITGIKSITVTYTSSASLLLYSGSAQNPSGTGASLTSGTALDLSGSNPSYFTLEAGAKVAYIKSISIAYSCYSVPTLTSISAQENKTTYQKGEIYAASNSLTVKAHYSNGVETPLSYDPTGANGYSLSGLDQDNNDFDPAVAFTGNNHYLLEAVYQNLHSNTWSISSVDPEHPIAVSGVSLNQTSAVLSPGKTLQLTASVAPSDAFDQACSFSSSNSAVCSVDSTSGLVSAQSVGKATITVTTHDGGFSAACEVSVEEVQNFTKGDYYSGTVDYRHLGLQSGYTSLPTVDNDLDVLVVPVQMSGYAFPSGTLERIKTAFNGTSEATGYWESVKSFYSKSSYGRLSFDFDVTSVYSCSYTPKTFVAIDSNTYQYPTMKLVNDIVTWYSGLANHRALSDFDNDGDGYIDAIWMIYSCPDYSTDSTMPEEFWAYRFWQYDNTASVSSPTANSYAWASYDFMNEGGGTSKVDAHTYIHETGHLLGLDDYYNYNDSDSYQPLGEIAMQDANITDHDIWSKLAFNWVKPYVVKGDCTITINPSETSGDCIVIADPKSGWNGTPFDEMLIMELFTNDGLNELDCTTAYSSRTKGYSLPGVRLQHVDARLSQVKYTNQSTSYGSYLDLTSLPYTNSTYEAAVAHSNSSGTTYGGKNDNFRLNSLVQSGGANTLKTNGGGAKDSDLFHTGSSFSMSSHKAFFNGTTTFNNGNPFPYTIRFDSVSKTSATITFQQI